MSPLMRILILILVMGIAMLFKSVNDALKMLPTPTLPLNRWWGAGEAPQNWAAYLAENSAVSNYRIMYSQATIDDLRQQLNRTVHLTPPLEGVAFEYGFNSNYLKELIEYWRDDYLPRWSKRERFLTQYEHFSTDIQGLRIHFLHLMVSDDQKVGKQHYPVLLLHGWPGSVREFYELIEKLRSIQKDNNNKYIFSVVVPSLPGFGWSQGASKTGLGCAQIAILMRQLMLRLGYEQFFIQGGDWGSVIGSHIATLFPENVIGYHSNMCLVFSLKAQLKGAIAALMPNLFAPKGFEDLFFPMSQKWEYLLEESGYLHLQATKPDTIGNALVANPVGLAAYILEKFSTWTNSGYRKLNDGGLGSQRLALDALFDNLMIYYLTNSITTSQRIYAETNSREERALQLERVPTAVPTGCARFKHDLMHSLDYQLRDKYTNLVHSTYYRDGGHFAALEQPQLLYHDFIEFVKKVEKQLEIK